MPSASRICGSFLSFCAWCTKRNAWAYVRSEAPCSALANLVAWVLESVIMISFGNDPTHPNQFAVSTKGITLRENNAHGGLGLLIALLVVGPVMRCLLRGKHYSHHDTSIVKQRSCTA